MLARLARTPALAVLARTIARAATVAVLAAPAAAAQATIVGTVFDSLVTLRPLRGATVVIPELARYVASDAAGRFRIDSVPAGRYTMTFLHPMLDSLDIAAERFPVTVPASGTVTTRLATPSPASLVWLVCRALADTFPAMMLGHVRDARDSSAVAGVRLDAAWSELVLGVRSLDRQTQHASSASRANGAYVLCGLPANVPLDVELVAGASDTVRLSLALGGALFQRRDFFVAPNAAAVNVSGTVRDGAGLALRDVVLTVRGRAVRATSDSAGAFVLRGVAVGTQQLDVRRVGYWPTTQTIDVPVGGMNDLRPQMGRRGRSSGVAPTGPAAAIDDPTGFEDRRQAGIGQFVTLPAQTGKPIKVMNDLLERAPMLSVPWRDRLKLVRMRSAADEPCVPTYFVNGVAWRPGVRDLAQKEIQSLLEPTDIRGVEVYGPAAIPPMFDRRNGCGVVVMWIRGKTP